MLFMLIVPPRNLSDSFAIKARGEFWVYNPKVEGSSRGVPSGKSLPRYYNINRAIETILSPYFVG